MMNPCFEPLSLEKSGHYLELYRACPRQSSYYSFGSLWAWRNVFGLSWAFAGGCADPVRGDNLWARLAPGMMPTAQHHP